MQHATYANLVPPRSRIFLHGGALSVAATGIDHFEQGGFKISDPTEVIVAIQLSASPQRRGEALGLSSKAFGLQGAIDLAIARVQVLFQVKNQGHVRLEHENLVPTSSFLPHVLLVRWLKDQLKLIKLEDFLVVAACEQVGILVPASGSVETRKGCGGSSTVHRDENGMTGESELALTFGGAHE
jgi:hypothetical protein